MNGFAGAVIIYKPHHIVSSWNIKMRTAVVRTIREKGNNPWGLDEKDLCELERQRNIPREYIAWAKKFFPKRVKPDGYGLIGGSADQGDASWEECLRREMLEEAYEKIFRFSCEEVLVLKNQDYAKLEESYDDHFFLVFATGVLKKIGAPGETEAPEVLAIKSFRPGIIYPKHAYALWYTLRFMVERKGMNEYRDDFAYISKTFAEIIMSFQRPNTLKDEDDWARFTSQKDIVRIR